jgi:hypothetical protein
MNEGDRASGTHGGLGNRGHARGERRRPRVAVAFTDAEWARIVAAAALGSKRPGAWVAQVAHDAARYRLGNMPGNRDALAALVEQVRSVRNVLANIGGNLNDVARHANTTHEVATVRVQAETVLRLVRRVVDRADEMLGELVGVLDG